MASSTAEDGGGGAQISDGFLVRLIDVFLKGDLAPLLILLSMLGGAIALYLGVRYPKRLAGILALSCYLVGADTLAEERSELAVFSE